MKPTIAIGALCAGLLFHANAAGSAPANWPQFRGPNSQGVAETAKPPVAIGPDKALFWRPPPSPLLMQRASERASKVRR